MLSRDQLQELGRFKLLMRKMHHQSVQIEKFLMDLDYQTHMLDIAEEFDDSDIENDELMILSLILRSKFGRLGKGDEAYASILPEVTNTSPVGFVPQMSEAVLKIPTSTIASLSTNSVSLLRSIGSSFASALNQDSGISAMQKSNTSEITVSHSESDKNHYVMRLR